jgi:hypothetical protein
MQTIPLAVQAELLGVSRSSLYYRPRPPSAEEVALKHRIDAIYTEYPFYGSRRITAQLRREGREVNRKAVQRHMREMGIAGICPGPNVSRRARGEQVYPYLLRNLICSYPNQVWGIEIVCTQMTKTDVFAVWLCREDVANLDLVISDHDPVDKPLDKPLDELSALLEGRRGESRLDTQAKVVQGTHDTSQLLTPLHLLRQLPLLVGERLVLLVKLPPSTFLLGEGNDAVQIRVGEPLPLLLDAAPPFAHHVTSRLPLLW